MSHPWDYRAEPLPTETACHDCQRYIPYGNRMPAHYLVIATHRVTGAEQLGRYCKDHANGIARRRGFELPQIGSESIR